MTTLYDIALQVTDGVLGDGTYASLNANHPDPGVQEAITRWRLARASARVACNWGLTGRLGGASLPTVKNKQPRRFQVHYGTSSRHPGDKGYVITDAGDPPRAAAMDAPRVFTSDSKSETIAKAETMNAQVEDRPYSLPNAIECADAELGVVSYTYDIRSDSAGHRWRCSCGESCGGRRFDSEEEAVKRADRHMSDKHGVATRG